MNKKEDILLYNVIQKLGDIKNLEFKLLRSILKNNLLNQSMYEIKVVKAENMNIEKKVTIFIAKFNTN